MGRILGTGTFSLDVVRLPYVGYLSGVCPACRRQGDQRPCVDWLSVLFVPLIPLGLSVRSKCCQAVAGSAAEAKWFLDQSGRRKFWDSPLGCILFPLVGGAAGWYTGSLLTAAWIVGVAPYAAGLVGWLGGLWIWYLVWLS